MEEGVNHPSWSGGQAVVVSLRWSHSRLHSLILSESLCLHPLHCDRTEAEHCPSCPLQSGDCAQSWGVGGGGGGGGGGAGSTADLNNTEQKYDAGVDGTTLDGGEI